MNRFDPYHTWLGIPPEEQPPNHYRLLGINLFESDRNVIRNAADQRMTYLKTYGGGVHSELSQKLLNEVSAAKVCLLNHERKSAYDAWLRQQLKPSIAEPVPTESIRPPSQEDGGIPPVVTANKSTPPPERKKKAKSFPRMERRYLPWIGAVLVLVVSGMVLAWIFASGSGLVRIALNVPLTEVQVQLDGEVVSVSQLKSPLEVEAGQHKLLVTGRRYQTLEHVFEVEHGEEKLVKLEVKPHPAVAPFTAQEARKFQQLWAEYLGVSVRMEIELGQDADMSFVLIPPGEFMMGSPTSENHAWGNDHPQHLVRITQPFYLGMTEVTQAQWEAVMKTRPWHGKDDVKEGSDYPASYVSWAAAVKFCEKLGKNSVVYRLPTEAEWEYACRAGTTTLYCFGNNSSDLKEYAWFKENSSWVTGEQYAHRVAQKKPNPFRLYDIHGNVWEWCGDWYDTEYYSDSPADDPPGARGGSELVVRGGGWNNPAESCRSSRRFSRFPGHCDGILGFRVACPLFAKSRTEDLEDLARSSEIQGG